MMRRMADLRFIISDVVVEKLNGMDLVNYIKDHFEYVFEDLLTTGTEVDDEWVEDDVPNNYYKHILPLNFTPKEVSLIIDTLDRALFEKEEEELLNNVLDKLNKAWKLHKRAVNV